MQTTIKIVTIFQLCFICNILNAQEKDKPVVTQKNNVLKINLPALAFKNISVQYERKVSKRISIAANVHAIPYGSLPFQSAFKNVGNNSDVQYDQFKLGSFGLIPELRFYVGRKGALHGFYIGPFVSYSNYKVDLPINYSNNSKTGIFSGALNTITGGLQIGSQFSLGKHIVLDWWILGPNYGSETGTFSFTGALSPSDQSDLSNQLASVKSDAPFNAIQSYSVSSTGASLTTKSPWGGLRGGGFNFGFRF